MKVKIALLFLVLMCALKSYASVLTLPTCQFARSLDTEVHFYISKDVLDEYSPQFVKAKIDAWIAYSNLTLKNSCIPTTRRVTHIEYVSQIDSSWFQDISVAERLLINELNRTFPEVNKQGEPIFNAIVFANAFDSYKSLYCGYASSSSFFFTIAINCPDSVLEHEIGHLSGASHDIKTLSYYEEFDLDAHRLSTYPPLKNYSLGYICGERGTIMSYEDNHMPVYSSPDIKWNGKACGESDKADNRRVMVEFARQYFEQ